MAQDRAGLGEVLREVPGDDGSVADSPPRTRTIGDLLLSLAILLGIVGFVVLFVPRPNTDAVRVVDYTTLLTEARSDAPYPILAPVGLSDRWRATSARYEPDETVTTWHLGFVTPQDAYAGVEQSNGQRREFVQEMTNDGGFDGTTEIDGVIWERRLRESKAQRSLVLTQDNVTTIVTGTASWDELRELAAALR
jgi:Protein of unknown function (DUF4245)